MSASPYSPFFTSGFLSAPTLSFPRSFLSLDLAESTTSHFSVARQSSTLERSLPSQKPVPSTTLPDVPPPISSSPPRLPSISVDPVLRFSLDPLTASPPIPRRSRSSSLARKRFSSSTVSTRARRANRSHALARLEGRKPSKHVQANFMSMSDDEDDDLQATRAVTLSAILEPEDVVFPTDPYPNPHHRTFPTSVVSNSHDPTNHDWFPLKSFLDFQVEDDLSKWNWRSFIQVASVA